MTDPVDNRLRVSIAERMTKHGMPFGSAVGLPRVTDPTSATPTPIDKAAAMNGVSVVIDALGLSVNQEQLELITDAFLGLIAVVGNAAQKHAVQAGVDAANKIQTPDDAERAAEARR